MEKKVLIKIECDDLDFDDYDIEDADRALVKAYSADENKTSDTSLRYYEDNNDDLDSKVLRYAKEALKNNNKSLASIIVCDNDTKELLYAYTVIDRKKYAFTPPTIKYGKEDFFRLKRRIDNKPPRVKKSKETEEDQRLKIENYIKSKEEDMKNNKKIAIVSGIVAGLGVLMAVLNKDAIIKDFQIYYGIINATVQEAAQTRLKAGILGGLGVSLLLFGGIFSGLGIKEYLEDKKIINREKDKLKIK